ncbi:MAG: phosphatase PAP2 family protein [Candidatus Woesearchaeota archaeon]
MKDLKHLMDIGFQQLTELGGAVITGIIAVTILFFDVSLAIRIILGIIGVMIISYLIKILFFKQRPKKQSTDTFIKRIDASSFPSVHSARITTFVFWIILYFGNIYLSVFAALIGISVAYSRVYLKKHYWNDVTGGIVIAIIINMIIYLIIGVTGAA